MTTEAVPRRGGRTDEVLRRLEDFMDSDDSELQTH